MIELFIKSALKTHDLMSRNEEYRSLIAKSATVGLSPVEKKRKFELEQSS
ncbi:hypothetical protein ACEXF2_019920 [Acinetobacter baumannii]